MKPALDKELAYISNARALARGAIRFKDQGRPELAGAAAQLAARWYFEAFPKERE